VVPASRPFTCVPSVFRRCLHPLSQPASSTSRHASTQPPGNRLGRPSHRLRTPVQGRAGERHAGCLFGLRLATCNTVHMAGQQVEFRRSPTNILFARTKCCTATPRSPGISGGNSIIEGSTSRRRSFNTGHAVGCNMPSEALAPGRPANLQGAAGARTCQNELVRSLRSLG
jgi:hypothetical protein